MKSETIMDALKDEDNNVRLACEGRWMIWDNQTNEWVVYEHRYSIVVARN